MAVRLKRAYEQPGPTDGYRVLIDRLWPRGVPREKAQLDEWLRELAPSTELRRWFGHDPARFAEFSRRYVEELSAHEDKVRELRGRARRGRLTLVYGARDTEHNDAVVLAELLRGEKRPGRRTEAPVKRTPRDQRPKQRRAAIFALLVAGAASPLLVGCGTSDRYEGAAVFPPAELTTSPERARLANVGTFFTHREGGLESAWRMRLGSATDLRHSGTPYVFERIVPKA